MSAVAIHLLTYLLSHETTLNTSHLPPYTTSCQRLQSIFWRTSCHMKLLWTLTIYRHTWLCVNGNDCNPSFDVMSKVKNNQRLFSKRRGYTIKGLLTVHHQKKAGYTMFASIQKCLIQKPYFFPKKISSFLESFLVNIYQLRHYGFQSSRNT